MSHYIMFVFKNCFPSLEPKNPAVHKRRPQAIEVKKHFRVYLALPVSSHRVDIGSRSGNQTFITDLIEFCRYFPLENSDSV